MESTVVPVKWAQHKKIVFLTLEAKNLSSEGRVISLTPEGHLHFEGTNKVTSCHYSLDLNLHDEVVVETTKWKVTDYCVQFSISKKNETAEFWPRLIKEKGKVNNITIDWTRWVDEDEADSKKMDYDSEGFGDLPDEDDEDSDDQEADLGDLEGENMKEDREEDKEEEKEEKKGTGAE